MKIQSNNKSGFTLLEILIALFIFSMVAVMLVSSLHTVISAQSGTETRAARLRDLQMTLLIMSRDVAQAVNRPIVNAAGKEEPAFSGSPESFQFTHLGYANIPSGKPHSHLQRTGYAGNEHELWRLSLPVLDQAPQTQPERRRLTEATEARFQYLDDEGHFRDKWPTDDSKQPLPRGVRIYLVIPKWGKITQLLLIPAQETKKDNDDKPGVKS